MFFQYLFEAPKWAEKNVALRKGQKKKFFVSLQFLLLNKLRNRFCYEVQPLKNVK